MVDYNVLMSDSDFQLMTDNEICEFVTSDSLQLESEEPEENLSCI